MGIVSATHRNDLGINAFENYIQTDAAINPGNSGGPLIDSNGNMVGINNVIYSRSGGYQGIGFAIPIKLAKEVIGELIHSGQITRGWLGISVRKLTDELRASLKYPKGDGVVIGGVMREGPANVAGIQSGDIIISVNNKPTKEPSEVLGITSNLKPKQTVNMAVVRGGQIYDFKVVIGKRPQVSAPTLPQSQ
jgi:S1-C subfamily serine protease